MRGKQPLLDLMAPRRPLRSASADSFAQTARRQREATESAVAGRATPAAALRLMDGTRARLIQSAGTSPRAKHRRCRAQCSACCYAPRVDVTPLEALAIAEHLRRRKEPLATIKSRLARYVAFCKRLTKGESLANIPYALLTADNECAVYESRPLACVGRLGWPSARPGSHGARREPVRTQFRNPRSAAPPQCDQTLVARQRRL